MKNPNKKIICFDLDGVICTNTWGKYKSAKPIAGNINFINFLYKKNFKIIIFTSRFMGRNKDNVMKANKSGYKFTEKQLQKWKLKYHKLILGKPSYDILVDDKSIFFKKKWVKELKNQIDKEDNSF